MAKKSQLTELSGEKKILSEALKGIEKQFWKGAVMRMGDNEWIGRVNTYHSGSYILDTVLWGWYPEWRVIEIYGLESSWKTTIALHAIAEVQKLGGVAALIDAEHALDPEYAANLWVDIDNLLLSQPDYGEQALQIAQELARTWAVKLIVIDSVAAMVPRAEVEGDMGDSHMGLQARMMSQWLRKLTSILAKTGTMCIFINQIRMKIGLMYGNPETTTWGNALKFYASQRLEIRRWEKMTRNKEDYGYYAKVKVVKNKVAPPFKVAMVPIHFGTWIARNADMIEAALSMDLISRAGAFYSYADHKSQGKDNLIEWFEENPEMVERLWQEIQTKIKNDKLWKKSWDEEAETETLDDGDSLEVSTLDEIVADVAA